MQTHRLLRAVPLMASTVLLAVCEPREYDERETRPAEEVPAPAPSPDSPAAGSDTMSDAVGAQRTIPFQPGPKAETSGTVRISETQTQGVTLGVNLTGLTEGEHAWHIRHAPCGVEGPIAVAISPAAGDTGSLGQPLRADAAGSAGGTVTIPANQVPPDLLYAVRPEDPADPESHAKPLSLQVHAGDGADPGPIVACADLTVMAPPTTR